MIEDWGYVTLVALQGSWQTFLGFLPKLLGSVIIFILGWLVAVGIGKLIAEILDRLRFNKLFDRSDWKQVLENADLKVNPSDFIGAICKWILVIVFLLASVEILGFVQFANFLNTVVAWMPNLLVAVAIFVVAVIIADILEKLIKAGVRKIGVQYAGFLGMGLKIAIYIFAGLAILLQLGIATTIINTLITGFVAMISLAFGLSFGLGGKDAAAKFIEDIKGKVADK